MEKEIKEIKEIEKVVKKELELPKEDFFNSGKTNSQLSEALKKMEKKVVEIIEDCKLYRDTFILKKELIRKLEEAFPEK